MLLRTMAVRSLVTFVSKGHVVGSREIDFGLFGDNTFNAFKITLVVVLLVETGMKATVR